MCVFQIKNAKSINLPRILQCQEGGSGTTKLYFQMVQQSVRFVNSC